MGARGAGGRTEGQDNNTDLYACYHLNCVQLRTIWQLNIGQKITKKLDPRKFRVAYLQRKLSHLESVIWIQADEIETLSKRIEKLEKANQ